ncbi:MAG: 4'-phosphopantetheinyl transferase superfamily protein [Clostridiales bacterium]|nr:4'-phosphopantetheinyl transferase superfamily protein [Clostridiales bacterium]
MTCVCFADVTPLEIPGYYATVIERLSPERRRKAEACRTKQGRLLSAGAGYLLSYALSLLGVNEACAAYSYNQYGKPRITGQEHLDFSLAHSGKMAMCALSDSGQVGCDIEAPGRHNPSAAKRFFHPNEYHKIINSDDPGRDFIRLWTLKESYLKALGTGLATPLSSFEIVPGNPPYLCGNDEYHFAEFHLENGYHAAVCSLEKAACEPIFVDFSTLQNN